MKPLDPQPSRIVVVGAGAFGASAALELAHRGHHVTIVDRGPLPNRAASSTDISKMVRMDYGSDVFYHELGEAALAEWDEWNASRPAPLYHESGFLVLADGDMEPGGFEYESQRVLAERGYDVPPLDQFTIKRRWPRWSAHRYQTGYFNTRGGWAESGRVVATLLEAARATGVDFVDARFASLREDAGRVVGIEDDMGQSHDADTVVVAAGAWTARLLPWLEDVMWATAQPVLHFAPSDPTRFIPPAFPPWAADIAGSGWYGFPSTLDGRVKVAHHALGRSVDPEDPGDIPDGHVERTRDFLRASIPELADAPVVERRVCMYCDTFDGDLWIDNDPERPGLVVAAGGSGHGFKFTPVLGAVIADVVERVPNRFADRFRWRDRGASKMEEARFDGA